MLKPLLMSSAQNAFEIGDQGFLIDERANKQLAMVVKPLQAGGDPAEFVVLFWSSRVVFHKANKSAVRFLGLDSRGHKAHDFVDPTPLKCKELEDFVSEGSCDPLGKLLAGNGRDAECWVLRRAPPDVEVEEIGSPRFRGLTADRERCG